MADIALGYGSLQVGVSTDQEGHLEWLVEFLSPQFRVLTGATPAYRVMLCCDPSEFARLEALDHCGRQVAAFTFDGRVVGDRNSLFHPTIGPF